MAEREPVGLVLAGGGARGAYELGALAELLPVLAPEEQPRIVLGTSVGALNTAYFAATADEPLEQRLADGERLWREIRYEDVLEPLLSPSELLRGLAYAGEVLGIGRAAVPSLLDPAPLRRTLAERIPFGRIAANVGRDLDVAAVVATSAATSLSVVFHQGGKSPPPDAERGITYVETELGEPHVLASAAIPVLFPAVEIERGPGAGWYFDGGTRLNAPIKPALALGARRLIVVALNSPARRDASAGAGRRPDALDGAGQLIQSVLVDPLVDDVRTLATVNQDAGRTGKAVIPYILVAPTEPDAIGRLAQAVFREHYEGLVDALRSRDLALIGRLVDADASPAHAELLSYVFFAPEFTGALIDMGRRDARAWIDAHPGDLWQTGPP
jgi:NTE family protein